MQVKKKSITYTPGSPEYLSATSEVPVAEVLFLELDETDSNPENDPGSPSMSMLPLPRNPSTVPFLTLSGPVLVSPQPQPDPSWETVKKGVC